jgi:hypothetical protein
MGEKVITNFRKGIEDCQHKWVYSRKGKIQMTFPQVFTTERICEKCGEYQTVQLDGMPKSLNNFSEIVKKFEENLSQE